MVVLKVSSRLRGLPAGRGEQLPRVVERVRAVPRHRHPERAGQRGHLRRGAASDIYRISLVSVEFSME